jgi:hypothetical protein
MLEYNIMGKEVVCLSWDISGFRDQIGQVNKYIFSSL